MFCVAPASRITQFFSSQVYPDLRRFRSFLSYFFSHGRLGRTLRCTQRQNKEGTPERWEGVTLEKVWGGMGEEEGSPAQVAH